MRSIAAICTVVAALAAAPAARAETASLTADFQPLVDGAITIAQVHMPADGFLVVRLPKDNKPFYGPVLAAVPLAAGDHSDLNVPLDPPPEPGATLGIILHQDDTTIGSYEFEIGKEADLPFFDGRRPILEVIGILEP